MTEPLATTAPPPPTPPELWVIDPRDVVAVVATRDEWCAVYLRGGMHPIDLPGVKASHIIGLLRARGALPMRLDR